MPPSENSTLPWGCLCWKQRNEAWTGLLLSSDIVRCWRRPFISKSCCLQLPHISCFPCFENLKATSGLALCRARREAVCTCRLGQLRHHPPAALAHGLLLLATSIVLTRTDHTQPPHLRSPLSSHTHMLPPCFSQTGPVTQPCPRSCFCASLGCVSTCPKQPFPYQTRCYQRVPRRTLRSPCHDGAAGLSTSPQSSPEVLPTDPALPQGRREGLCPGWEAQMMPGINQSFSYGAKLLPIEPNCPC